MLAEAIHNPNDVAMSAKAIQNLGTAAVVGTILCACSAIVAVIFFIASLSQKVPFIVESIITFASSIGAIFTLQDISQTVNLNNQPSGDAITGAAVTVVVTICGYIAMIVHANLYENAAS